MRTKRTLILPDLHLGSHDDKALRVALKIAEDYVPQEIVILGDWLDAHELSAHRASDRREAMAQGYFAEVDQCRELLAFFEDLPAVRRITFIEGNHEYRVERWAVAMGGFAESVVDKALPRVLLSANRTKRFRWIDYKAEDKPSHVMIAPGLIACHGWSVAKHAAAQHLNRAMGLSIIHGHTHRRQTYVQRHPITNRQIEGHSPGCLSKLQPLWVGGPTNWSQGVTLLNQRRDKWSLFTVPIELGVAIMPCGKSIKAGCKGSVVGGVA